MNKKPLLLACLATFLYVLALALIIPFLPFQILSLGGSYASVGGIFSAFSAASFLSAPLWGRACDRWGVKTALLASAFLTLLSYIVLFVAPSLSILYAARILAGLAAGWLIACQTLVAQSTESRERTRGLGLLGAAFGMGFAAGHALSAWLLGENLTPAKTPVLVACFVVLAAIALATTFSSLKNGARKNSDPKSAPPKQKGMVRCSCPFPNKDARLDCARLFLRLALVSRLRGNLCRLGGRGLRLRTKEGRPAADIRLAGRDRRAGRASRRARTTPRGGARRLLRDRLPRLRTCLPRLCHRSRAFAICPHLASRRYQLPQSRHAEPDKPKNRTTRRNLRNPTSPHKPLARHRSLRICARRRSLGRKNSIHPSRHSSCSSPHRY